MDTEKPNCTPVPLPSSPLWPVDQTQQYELLPVTVMPHTREGATLANIQCIVFGQWNASASYKDSLFQVTSAPKHDKEFYICVMYTHTRTRNKDFRLCPANKQNAVRNPEASCSGKGGGLQGSLGEKDGCSGRRWALDIGLCRVEILALLFSSL